MVSEPPHRIRLHSAVNPYYASISSDCSQAFVFISTPNTLNLYTANIVFELISQYTLTDEQSQEFGFIVDIKSSQTLPLLAVVTDKDFLLILTYEKDMVESFDKSNSDGSISIPGSTANFSSFLVSGELHLLMVFSLAELCSPPSSKTLHKYKSAGESTSTIAAKDTGIYSVHMSNTSNVATTWDKNSLVINSHAYLLAIDFDKIASSQIKVASLDTSTDTLSLTINAKEVYVGENQIGLVLVTHEPNIATNSIGNSLNLSTANAVGSYDNHIFFRDALNRLIVIGHSGATVVAEGVGQFAISHIIAYSTAVVGTVEFSSKAKSGVLERGGSVNVQGDVKMLSWCPQGRILAIVYRKSVDNGGMESDHDYRISFYGTGCNGLNNWSNAITTTKIQVSEVVNIAWSSLGLRLFMVTMDSIYLFDVFRGSGWHSGQSYTSSLLIGPSAILVQQSNNCMFCGYAERQFLWYDYPLSISSFWPFILAFGNPSLNLLLIRSYNGALLLCCRQQDSLGDTSHFITDKRMHLDRMRKESSNEANHSKIVYLNRYWKVLEFQSEAENVQDYESLPCCWIDDDLFLSVGISYTNLLNHTMKICKIAHETVTLLAQITIRRSPIIAKRIDFIDPLATPVVSGGSSTNVFFYLVTRFDKVDIYNWLRGTDIIQLVFQIDLSFPNKIFTSGMPYAETGGGKVDAENSSLGNFPKTSTNRQSTIGKGIDYLHIKSINIQSICIQIELDNTFKLSIVTENEMVKVVIVNGQATSGSIHKITEKWVTRDGGFASHNDSHTLCNTCNHLTLSGEHSNANPTSGIGTRNCVDYFALDCTKHLFEVSKKHFEENGRLVDLKLLDRKEQACNGMLMRICRMALEYEALDDSIFEIFDSFIASKDYLNASLILICIQAVSGVSGMISKFAKPLLIHAIKALGRQPSLAHLIHQLKRILETAASTANDKGDNMLEAINREILVAASGYVFYDFLGLLRVVLLLELPLVKVLSCVKLEWRLSDCETHFGSRGVTLNEMFTAIKRQFFTNYGNASSIDNCKAHISDNKLIDTDGWSLSAVFDLLLPLYYVCREAGANGLAFVIALSVGDKSLAQLSVNGHIAREIDRLDPECGKCNQAKQMISLIF